MLTRIDSLGGNRWLVNANVVLDPGMTTLDARGTVPGGGRGGRGLHHTQSGSSMRAGVATRALSPRSPVPARSNIAAVGTLRDAAA